MMFAFGKRCHFVNDDAFAYDVASRMFLSKHRIIAPNGSTPLAKAYIISQRDTSLKKLRFYAILKTGGDIMTLKLFFQALVKFISGVILVGLLVFLPAGTLNYFNGILFSLVLFVPIFIAGIVMMLKNPELLSKRLDAKEKQKDQSLVIKLSGLMFLVGFILPGLGYRLGWYMLPKGVSIAFAVVFLLSYLMFAEVMRENTYLSRTIEVQENQKVVDTGLYGIVRHPMYTATLFLFLSMPLVLGSVYSFAVFLVYPFIIAKRIKGEEELLEKELEGYKEYKQKVKYRLIPLVW